MTNEGHRTLVMRPLTRAQAKMLIRVRNAGRLFVSDNEYHDVETMIGLARRGLVTFEQGWLTPPACHGRLSGNYMQLTERGKEEAAMWP